MQSRSGLGVQVGGATAADTGLGQAGPGLQPGAAIASSGLGRQQPSARTSMLTKAPAGPGASAILNGAPFPCSSSLTHTSGPAAQGSDPGPSGAARRDADEASRRLPPRSSLATPFSASADVRSEGQAGRGLGPSSLQQLLGTPAVASAAPDADAKPWWMLLPNFVPVLALADGVDPRWVAGWLGEGAHAAQGLWLMHVSCMC